MLHYLREDNDLEKAVLDFNNFLKSKTCMISPHQKAIIKKLVEEIKDCAYSSGYANCSYDQDD